MFNNNYIKHLKEEIEYLRQQVKDLNDKLIDVSGINKKIEENSKPLAPIHVLNELTGKIESMGVDNEEDEKERDEAIEELYELESLAGSF